MNYCNERLFPVFSTNAKLVHILLHLSHSDTHTHRLLLRQAGRGGQHDQCRSLEGDVYSVGVSDDEEKMEGDGAAPGATEVTQ